MCVCVCMYVYSTRFQFVTGCTMMRMAGSFPRQPLFCFLPAKEDLLQISCLPSGCGALGRPKFQTRLCQQPRVSEDALAETVHGEGPCLETEKKATEKTGPLGMLFKLGRWGHAEFWSVTIISFCRYGHQIGMCVLWSGGMTGSPPCKKPESSDLINAGAGTHQCLSTHDLFHLVSNDLHVFSIFRFDLTIPCKIDGGGQSASAFWKLALLRRLTSRWPRQESLWAACRRAEGAGRGGRGGRRESSKACGAAQAQNLGKGAALGAWGVLDNIAVEHTNVQEDNDHVPMGFCCQIGFPDGSCYCLASIQHYPISYYLYIYIRTMCICI